LTDRQEEDKAGDEVPERREGTSPGNKTGDKTGNKN